MIRMLPYQFKNKWYKSEKQKEDIKLPIYLYYSCSLHAEYLWYIRKDFLTNIQLPMMLYVLH